MVTQMIPKISRALILADLLREQLNLPADAEEVLTTIIDSSEGSPDETALAILKRNAIYGEQWKMDLVQTHLEAAERLVGQGLVSTAVHAAVIRQRGNYLQQMAIELSCRAETAFEKSEALYREAGDSIGELWSAQNRAVTLHKRAEHQTALPIFERCTHAFRALGEVSLLAQTLVNFGSLKSAMGDESGAIEVYREAREQFAMLGNEHWVARCKVNLGTALASNNKAAEARALLLEAKRELETLDDWHWVANADKALASAIRRVGQEL